MKQPIELAISSLDINRTFLHGFCTFSGTKGEAKSQLIREVFFCRLELVAWLFHSDFDSSAIDQRVLDGLLEIVSRADATSEAGSKSSAIPSDATIRKPLLLIDCLNVSELNLDTSLARLLERRLKRAKILVAFFNVAKPDDDNSIDHHLERNLFESLDQVADRYRKTEYTETHNENAKANSAFLFRPQDEIDYNDEHVQLTGLKGDHFYETVIRICRLMQANAFRQIVEQSFRPAGLGDPTDEITEKPYIALRSTALRASGFFSARTAWGDPNRFPWLILAFVERVLAVLNDSVAPRPADAKVRFLACTHNGAVIASAVARFLRGRDGSISGTDVIDRFGPSEMFVEEYLANEHELVASYIYIGDFIIAGTELKLAESHAYHRNLPLENAIVITSVMLPAETAAPSAIVGTSALQQRIRIHSLIEVGQLQLKDASQTRIDLEYWYRTIRLT